MPDLEHRWQISDDGRIPQATFSTALSAHRRIKDFGWYVRYG
jgi:hypothetical protein